MSYRIFHNRLQNKIGYDDIQRFRFDVHLNRQPILKTNSNGSHSGIGLSNTRARLEQFYGDDFSFEIANNDGRGVTVTLDVPAKREG